MDFYGIDSKGKMILERVNALPSLTDRDRGRVYYYETGGDRSIYYSDSTSNYRIWDENNTSLLVSSLNTEGGINADTLDGQNSQYYLQRKNFIINGNFNIWQRATSQTISGFGSDDRWRNTHNGSTKTHNQQSFTLGQTDVPGEPTYYSRTVVSSSVGAANYCIKYQMIEDVRTLAGQTATLSFYAKADSSKNIAIDCLQHFGTDSTSSDVDAIGVTTCALTTSWQKFEITVNVPSISGKTLGPYDDHYLCVVFWFDAGSDYNSRTNSLGQQSGIFDIAQVQLEKGSAATDFEYRPIGEELALCQRYYEEGFIYLDAYAGGSHYVGTNVGFKQNKRATPTNVFTHQGGSNVNGTPSVFSGGENNGIGVKETANGAGYCYFWVTWTSDAEL